MQSTELNNTSSFASRALRCIGAVFTFILLVGLLIPTTLSGEVQRPASAAIELAFRENIEIFAPQGAVLLDVLLPIESLEQRGFINKTMELEVTLLPLETPTTPSSDTAQRRQATASKTIGFEQEIVIHRQTPRLTVSFHAPPIEGPYLVTVALFPKETTSRWALGNSPLLKRQSQPIFESTTQCLVINPHPLPRPVGDPALVMEKELLETVDTNRISRWKQWTSIPSLTNLPSLPKVGALTTPKMPELSRLYPFRERPTKKETPVITEPYGSLNRVSDKTARSIAEFLDQRKLRKDGPYGNGFFVQDQLGENETGYSRLLGSGSADQESWEAFPLPVREVGKPHLLEIDYPAEPIELGIAIIEELDGPAGKTPVLTTRAGMVIKESPLTGSEPARMVTHKLLFWPKTAQPMLLLANRDHRREAKLGRIRLYRMTGCRYNISQDEEVRHPRLFSAAAQRLLAGYLHRSDLLFSLASDNERNLDWAQAYQGSTRLLDLLCRSGYDGLFLNVAGSDRMLYPRPDLNGSGNENILELLFRLFDREGMALIPALEFDFPIPGIESLLAAHPEWASELLSEAGGRCRYNLMHPLVREEMLRFIEDLIHRSAQHSSFSGLALILSQDGYAQPGHPLQQLDDATVAQFEQETGILFPSTASGKSRDPNRRMARQLSLQNDGALMESWVAWRAGTITNFYTQITHKIRSVAPNAQLYLLAGTLLDRPEWQQFCTPTLGRRVPVHHPLRMLGLDLTLLAQTPGITFLRPSRLNASSEGPNPVGYQEFESNESAVRFSRFQPCHGSFFFHDPSDEYLCVPGGDQGRQRFVRHLTQTDCTIFVDGGFSIPGGEETQSEQIYGAFRALPHLPFHTYQPPLPTDSGNQTRKSEPPSLQPITIRYAASEDALYVYILNDAPFMVQAELTFQSPGGTIHELSGIRPEAVGPIHSVQKNGHNLLWKTRLEPFDMIAVKVDDPKCVLENINVIRPPDICAQGGQLDRLLEQFGRCIKEARKGVPWNHLSNADCELSGTVQNELADWTRQGNDHFSLTRDTHVKYSGNSSMKLANSAPTAADTTLRGTAFSRPIPTPPTGRLFVSLLVGVPDQADSLPLTVSLTGIDSEQPFYCAFQAESVLMPLMKNVAPVDQVRWHRLVIPFDRLPSEEIDQIRLGFEWTGPGTVWIDEITLYQLAFTRDEINELLRLVSVADLRHQGERYSDLIKILEGHWARMLMKYVIDPGEPLSTLSATANSSPKSVPAKEEKPYAKNAKNQTKEKEAKPPAKPTRSKNWFFR